MDLTVLNKISYGMFIVSSAAQEKKNGQIANTVFQVSATPPLIAISINRANLTHAIIEESRAFAVSIITEDAPLVFIGKFGFKSGREHDKFTDTRHCIVDAGMPVVQDYALGYCSARVIASLPMATHTLFVGEVISAALWNDGRPMTYEYYHAVKRGRTQKNAPTFNP